ncbi:hypothetical protein ACQXW1_11215 [Lactiplantibacillus pentosus]|uniref:hypothetical protein n=1 Tax=Lactiplantibacillus pentosus TaxID=1589 RepID=UPI001403543E|nr:hypothetical protein [Lactiplantibacillus pentosus]MCH4130802.1 hypothetical protein [Lactiplantibacillus sp.]USJ87910.1 hypothetical protein KSF55_09745 [Lactiplantibacillus pentosus]UXI96248.1 hypothetical protein N5A89_09610 [Lactiplantibacillus pentosus]
MLETSLTVEYQNFFVPRNQRLIQQKVGAVNVYLSNTAPAGRYSGQGPVVKFHLASVFCLVSERPVFKTWFVGLNLRPQLQVYAKLAPFSSGPQLAAFGFKNRHFSIIIQDKY